MSKNNPFKIALAARTGELKPDVLHGAAKRIYNDTTLSDEALKIYAKRQKPARTLQTQPTHSTFKY